VRRRDLLAAVAALAATPRFALADVKTLPLDKAFPYLAGYLSLPASQRTRFYPSYRALRNRRPVNDIKATIIAAGGARTPLALDAHGVVEHAPSLAQLKSGAMLEVDGPPTMLGIELRAAAAPATRVDVVELAAALAQANAAIAKLAGALSFAAPKLTAAYFPDAGQGRAMTGDGRASPLPVFSAPIIGAVAYFEPASLAGAKLVLLDRTPSRILLGGHPKPA
jgi:hypothetical protein